MVHAGGVKILVAEDDTRLSGVLVQALSEAGWQVDAVLDGRSAFDQALSGAASYDVLPILRLTARGQVRDRITGLDAGADDYLAKPFDVDELLARLRALTRRGESVDGQPVVVGDLVVDPRSRRVSRGDVEITLSARE